MSNKLIKQKKRHTSEHYVPQVYMKQWSVKQSMLQVDYISSKPIVYGMNGFKQIQPFEIQHINCIDNLYEVQDYDDELYRTTEDAFGEHESNLGIILPRIEKAGLKLDEVGVIKRKEHNMLCNMVAVMLTRHPLMLPMTKQTTRDMKFERTGDATLGDLMLNAGAKMHYTDEDSKLALDYVLNAFAVHPKSGVTNLIRERIKEQQCYILLSEKEFFFSNMPVYFNAMLTEFYMPVSPKYAVYFSKEAMEELHPGHINKVDATAWNMKLRTALGAKFLYSSHSEYLTNFASLF